MAQSDLVLNPAHDVRAGGVSLRQALTRVSLLVISALVQVALISFFYDPEYQQDAPNAVVGFLRTYSTLAVHSLVLLAATFAVINWTRRNHILASWRSAIDGRPFLGWIALNAAVLVAVLVASAYISISIDHYARFIAPYLLLLAALGATYLLTIAPVGFWRALIAETWVSLLIAAAISACVLLFSRFAQAGWEPLAGATLHVSHWILTLYESNVFVDVASKELGVGQFIVNIAPNCSGYEGIGLVTAFLTLYLVVFRKDLAFPNAIALIPIGIITIWLLNALRISLLVSIGAHLSPQVAVGGFHSQAGWLAFLLVTVGLMAASHTMPVFRKARGSANAQPVASAAPMPAVRHTDDDALAWLAPFIGLMAASIIAGAFVPYDRWLYGLRVVAIAFAIWAFWSLYWDQLKDRADWIGVLAGAAVGAAWIATDPAGDGGEALGAWLLAQSPWAAALWLAIRGAGTVVFVPIAEEFAFRGYLHRLIASGQIGRFGPLAMTVVACVVTSVLFGAIHQRWLAGALAGAAFTFVMYRSGRLSSAVIAHMSANAVIFVWAIAFRQWSLL